LPDGSPVFEKVISGTEVYDTLLRPPIDVSEEEAARRLRGSLLGADGASTCVVLAFDPNALADRARFVSLIHKAAVKHCEIPAEELHLAGPVLDGLEVDRASQASLDRFALPSALGVLFTCLLFLRSQRAAWLVFLLSVFCEGATLALVHFCGDSLSALLIVLPPLIQTAAVSGGIHLVNYYFDFHESGEADPFGKALRTAWLPCALSAGTTAIGLASLMVSDLSPIRAFGAYGGTGMVLTTALLLTAIPGAFLLWPRALLGTQTKPHSTPLPLASGPDSPGWNLLARGLTRWGTGVAAACALLTVGLGWGTWNLRTSVRIETLLGTENRLLRDYAWLEQQIGPLVPLEVVVRFDRRTRLTALQRLELIDRLHAELTEVPGVGGTLSASTFAPLLECPEGVEQARYAELARQLLEAGKPRLQQAGYLHEGTHGESWRLTARVSALEPLDYGLFETAVAERLTGLLTDETGRPLPGVTLSCTGIMPVVHAIQQQLFADLFSSFLSALVVITLVMIVVQGGLVAGLLSMASNLFPIALVFGWLGWIGGTVDIGGVLTASVALGIAIDNTLHLLTFFRREEDCPPARRCEGPISTAGKRCCRARWSAWRGPRCSPSPTSSPRSGSPR
jgi:predicted RND superfamily exporter protein